MRETKTQRTFRLLRDVGPLTGAEVRAFGRIMGDERGYYQALGYLRSCGRAEFGRHRTVCAVREVEEAAWSVRRGQ